MSEFAKGQIIKFDDEKRLVFGWASIIKDSSGKVLVDRQEDFIDSEDELEKAAYDYVLKSRDGGEMHVRRGVSTMVESVVLSAEKQQAMGIPNGVVPVGWWVGFKVNDERVWGEVKKGGYVGFSVHGTGKRNETEVEVSEITEVEKSAASEPDVVEYDAKYYSLMSKAVASYTASIIDKAMRKRVSKYNKNHDARGRFTSAGGGGGGAKSKGGSKKASGAKASGAKASGAKKSRKKTTREERRANYARKVSRMSDDEVTRTYDKERSKKNAYDAFGETLQRVRTLQSEISRRGLRDNAGYVSPNYQD